MGSPRFRTAETAFCTVTDAWFPANSLLPRHTHDRAIFAVMLAGSFANRIVSREYDCSSGSFWTEPLGEPHANRGGAAGARVFVVQPHTAREEELAPFAPLLDEVRYERQPQLALDARRVLQEIGSSDPLAAIAIDSLVLQMFVAATRLTSRDRHHMTVPAWVRRAREYADEHYRTSFSISELAALLDVSASRLAHAFRRFYSCSISEYARARRLSWALEQLEHSNVPIAKIAMSAGFCDQSHLTREVKRALGVGAAAYRRERTKG